MSKIRRGSNSAMGFGRDWNDFWYRPAPSGPLGLFRIFFGLIVIAYGALLFKERADWFSDHGVIPSAIAEAFNSTATTGPRPFSFLNHPLPDWELTLFFLYFMLMAVMFTIGLSTRFSAIAVWICMNALHNRNGPILNSGDTLMLVLAFYAVLAPCGASCSIDRLWQVLRGKQGDNAPKVMPWGQRVMQLQISLLYLCTALGKCQGTPWTSGMAAYIPLQLPEMARFPVPFIDAQHIWLINLLTYGTLAVEFSLAFLVWVPRLRLYVLAAATLFHLGLEYSMNIPLFELLMIVSFMVFLKESDLVQFAAWARARLWRLRMQLVFDGECDFCRSALLIVHYFDVLRLITFIDYHDAKAFAMVPQVRWEDADVAAIAVDWRGRQYKGFDAFRAATWRLPALWLIAPCLYIPGVPAMGRIVYKWIATHRSIMPVAPRFAHAAANAEERESVLR